MTLEDIEEHEMAVGESFIMDAAGGVLYDENTDLQKYIVNGLFGDGVYEEDSLLFEDSWSLMDSINEANETDSESDAMYLKSLALFVEGVNVLGLNDRINELMRKERE